MFARMIDWIDIPIYKCSVVILVDATLDDWEIFYGTHKNELTERDNINVADMYSERNTNGFCMQTEGGYYICHISDKENIGLVAHEIFHVANMLLADKGYKHDYCDEPEAYLIEFLINAFYHLIGEEKEKKL